MLTAALFTAEGDPAHAVPGVQAAHTQFSAHRLWTHRISPNADSAPVYLRPQAGRCPATTSCPPLLYVLAGNNRSNCNPGDPVKRATLYALDARNGAVRWTRSTSGPSRCTTAGPVVDPTGHFVYAPGLDGKLHRYDALSGRETPGKEWPAVLTLMPDVEKTSATPTIAGRYLYSTTSGFIGDQGHYQGHLVTIDLKSGPPRVFNSLCSTIHVLLGPDSARSNYCSYERSGFFGRGQGVVDPVDHAVYVVTGNGPWNGKTNWGDSILKLTANGSKLLDSYTPTNQRQLKEADADLGSTGPALLPPVTSQGHTYHLLVQGGKGPACSSCGGVAIRVLNRENLSGHRSPGNLGGDMFDAQAPGGCEIIGGAAVWKGHSGQIWVFYANSCGTAGYRLRARGSHFRLDRIWSNGTAGTTPVLRGGILYVATNRRVVAYWPDTGHTLGIATGLGGMHWEYPTVAGNRLFISDENGQVSAYALGT